VRSGQAAIDVKGRGERESLVCSFFVCIWRLPLSASMQIVASLVESAMSPGTHLWEARGPIFPGMRAEGPRVVKNTPLIWLGLLWKWVSNERFVWTAEKGTGFWASLCCGVRQELKRWFVPRSAKSHRALNAR